MNLQGVTSVFADEQIKKVGLNEIKEKRVTFFDKWKNNLLSPVSGMLIIASAFSFYLDKIFDGYFILILLGINVVVTIWQEKKADNAISKLNDLLSKSTETLRDDRWVKIDSRYLVKGDLIKLGLGEVVPADGEIVSTTHCLINESVLTGESFPVEKKVGDKVYSGSFVNSGSVYVRVGATGSRTKFGKIIFSVSRKRKKSILEKDVAVISKFLLFLSLVCIVLISSVLFYKKLDLFEIFTLDLSLLVAGIPISLPTVMTLIIEFGVISLSKKSVVVRRISALEDLANVSFLLTDKTGTLTKNKIEVKDVYAYGKYNHKDVLKFASRSASKDVGNPISDAILSKSGQYHNSDGNLEVVDFTSADSLRKRSTLVYKNQKGYLTISVGAPQIIVGLCKEKKTTKEKFSKEVSLLAENGFRTIAVSVSDTKEEKAMKLVGILALSDTIREDARGVINFLKSNGIDVSMVTGDNRAIAYQVMSHLVSEREKHVTKTELDNTDVSSIDRDYFKSIGSFSEILPEDKLKLVELAKKYFVVAATGDGVNDLPPVKSANVGIAVANAVDALKSTADIVLLSEGIKVIKDAIIESRKIFERIYTYSLYRISESFRLLITIAVLSLIYQNYPLNALQIIILALLNDLPIISLASDRVQIAKRPSVVKIKERFFLSTLYGFVGVANSLIMFYLITKVFVLPWPVVQTMYFLKLTVSGHLLIYVAHTKERWYKFLPSSQVIFATTLTQMIATFLAVTGFMMPAKLSLGQIGFVWIWSFFWMQIGEVMKMIKNSAFRKASL